MTAKAKKKFLKIIIITLSSLILFCFIAFWIITSSGFITGVVLPMLDDSIGLRIRAEEVDLSLFKSRLTAKKLVLGSAKNPLVKAEKLDGYFSLSALLGGDIVFRDVVLDNAAASITKGADGKWSYESPKPSSAPEKPVSDKKTASAKKTANTKEIKLEKTRLDLKNIKITNSSLVLSSGDEKFPASMEFKDLNITLSELKNNSPGSLTIKSNLSIKSNSGITIEHGEWNASLTAAFDDYLRPYKIKLDSDLDKLDGTINGVKINNSNLALNIDGEGDEKGIVLNKFSLRQFDGKFIKTNLELNSYIKFDPFKIKGKIKIAPLSSEISSVLCQFTRQVNPGKVGVNLISDFEYSDSAFGGAGDLKLTRRGTAIIAGKSYKLPDLRLRSKYDFNFDHAGQALRVKYLSTELEDRGKKVLSLACDRPFTYFFGKQTFLQKLRPQVALELSQMDLTMIKLLQGPDDSFVINGGKLDGDIVCVLDHKRKLHFGANIKSSDLDFELDSKRFENLGFEQKISGYVSKNLFLAIPEFHLTLKNKLKNVVSFTGGGNVDFKKHRADFSLNMEDFSSDKIRNLPLPPETIKEITGISGKLNPFVVTAGLSGSMQLDKGIVKLKPMNLDIFQEKKKILNILVKPENGLVENLTNNSTVVLTVDKLATRQFKKLFNDDTLSGGYLNGKIVAKVRDDLKNIMLSSSLTVNDLELLRFKRIFRNLRFNLGFTTSIKDFEEIRIKQFVCGMRKNNKTILGLSGFGDLNISKGAGKLDLALDYLNHQSINIISPGKLKNGILKGKLNVDIQNRFKNVKIKSKLNMRQLVGSTVNEAVGGNSSFDMVLTPDLFFCKKFSIDVNSKSGKIVSVNGSTTLPKDAAKPVVINLKSDIIDLDKLKNLFATKVEGEAVPEKDRDGKEPEKKTEKTVKQAEPLEFDFGKKSYVMLVDLRGIKYSSILTAHLNSRIVGEKRHLAVKHLQISSNEDKINFKGDFFSTPKGIKYNVDLKGDKLDLNPVFRTFLRDDLQKMRGVLKNIHVELAGTGLQPPVLWDNMNGSVRSEFKNVKIPNNLSKTTMGKIFLLPFEIMVDIQKMVPGKVVDAMGQAARYVMEFQRDMKVLNFRDGKIRLEARDGLIYVIDFQLYGKIVKNFSFAGKFSLGTLQVLDLKSRLDINGIILPVDMAGTVDKPKINYRATTLKFMTANTFTILDTTGEILEKGGGDAKKILDIIFK